MSKLLLALFVSLFATPMFVLAETTLLSDDFTEGVETSSCIDFGETTLKFGATDATTNGKVTILQEFLISKGFLSGESTGNFRSATRSAVKAWQLAVEIGKFANPPFITNSATPGLGGIGSLSRKYIKDTTCGGTTASTITPTQTTIQATTTSSTSTQLPAGCTSTTNFSPLTGARCIAEVAPVQVVNHPPVGCSSFSGYSSTTGQLCSGASSLIPGISVTRVALPYIDISYANINNTEIDLISDSSRSVVHNESISGAFGATTVRVQQSLPLGDYFFRVLKRYGDGGTLVESAKFHVGEVPLSAPQSTPVLVQNARTLTVVSSGGGTVSSVPSGIYCGSGGTNCVANFQANTQFALTASPKTGNSFTGWSGLCASYGQTCYTSMQGNSSVTPIFTPIAESVITATIDNSSLSVSLPSNTSLAMPTITGTASNASIVYVQVNGNLFGPISVVNGRWSANITTALQWGTYPVAVLVGNTVYTSGTLTVGSPVAIGTSAPAPISTTNTITITTIGSVTNLTQAGITTTVKGNSGVDVVNVSVGASLDFAQSGLSTDEIHLAGNFSDYTKTYGGLVVTMTRTFGSNIETIKFLGGSTTDYDVIVFADYVFKSAEILSFLNGSALSPLLRDLNRTTSEVIYLIDSTDTTKHRATVQTPLGITINLTQSGVSTVVKGNSGVDTVNASAGVDVDFTQSLGGVDEIHLAGNYADYTKTYSGSVVTMTRTVGSNIETIRMLSGDKVYFANGSVSVLDILNFLKGLSGEPVLGTVVAATAPTPSLSSRPQLASLIGAFSQSSAPAVESSWAYSWTRNLEVGSPYTNDVSTLQMALVKEGVYAGGVTGGFYSQTYLAVKAFQAKHGIEVTGFVGPQTRALLNQFYGPKVL